MMRKKKRPSVDQTDSSAVLDAPSKLINVCQMTRYLTSKLVSDRYSCVILIFHISMLALNVVGLKTLKLMLYHNNVLEAKKGRTGGHSKSVVRMPPDESIFVQFLREAGVTLKQDKASNEIGNICMLVT